MISDTATPPSVPYAWGHTTANVGPAVSLGEASRHSCPRSRRELAPCDDRGRRCLPPYAWGTPQRTWRPTIARDLDPQPETRDLCENTQERPSLALARSSSSFGSPGCAISARTCSRPAWRVSPPRQLLAAAAERRKSGVRGSPRPPLFLRMPCLLATASVRPSPLGCVPPSLRIHLCLLPSPTQTRPWPTSFAAQRDSRITGSGSRRETNMASWHLRHRTTHDTGIRPKGCGDPCASRSRDIKERRDHHGEDGIENANQPQPVAQAQRHFKRVGSGRKEVGLARRDARGPREMGACASAVT